MRQAVLARSRYDDFMHATTHAIEIKLQGQPVEFADIAPFPSGAGGECVFLGRTRIETHPQHGELVRLCYEAYEPMAYAMLNSLSREAMERFGCLFIRVHHALGEVAPGQASVLVQVACKRRSAAFEACRFLIDQLKSIAPIWKREEWADGSTWSAGVEVSASSMASDSKTS